MHSIQATVLLALLILSGNVFEITADVPKIKDLASVIDPHLNGDKLVSYTSRYLTKPGDNYGSVMLAIMANVQKASGEIEELPLVAKLPPITNELFWHMIQPERTCLTENAVYKYLSPAIRLVQLEAGIQENDLFDGFAKYYGSRISLNPDSKKVDRDAVLVQENLISEEVETRTTMIKTFQIAFFTYSDLWFGKNELYQHVSMATNNNATYVNLIKELEQEYNNFVAGPEKEDDLFSSIVHSDLWINNLMLKYDESGQAIKVKFVDFQIAQYESCAHDIIFLLFSSVDIPVLEYHIDELLQFYYQAFIDSLKSVHVSTDEYSYVGFMKEIRKYTRIEICHALRILTIMLADNSTLPDDFKDININVLSRNVGQKNIIERTANIIRIAQKYKFFDKA